jgi:phage tail sheath protein FI
LVNTITPVFELAKNTDGLFDYQIICDDRNNTPNSIDNNELIVDIYIKPVRTAEFIQVNFLAVKTGTAFSELI